MLQLTLAALFFVGIHFGIAGTQLRDRLVARQGESVFRAGFSLLSILGIVWLASAYSDAPYIETWGQLAWFKPVAAALMLVAFLFAVTGLTTRNPTAVAGESALQQADAAHGIVRITRHPFLWGVSLWALTHLIANGDLAALILFGSLLLLCLLGTRSIDAKRRRACGESWERFAAVTSNIPFMAIKQGRNRLQLSEIGWPRLAGALFVYLAVMHFHSQLFGVSPLL
jgi:uncharacterized membrane protein